MNDLRTAAQQALETLQWHLDQGAWGADIEGVTAALRAALADQDRGWYTIDEINAKFDPDRAHRVGGNNE